MMKDPCILYTDASLTAIGSVSSQVKDEQVGAICYTFEALSNAQTRYSATKREMLAIINFTQHFIQGLLGQKFQGPRCTNRPLAGKTCNFQLRCGA